jgi:RimJ/RimL family protein N-acetyltransferase
MPLNANVDFEIRFTVSYAQSRDRTWEMIASRRRGSGVAQITLRPHDLKYAERIYELASAPQIKDALGLRDESVDDTKRFVEWVIDEERMGKQISRVIFNDRDELVGVTTLMFINRVQNRCHIGTWIGHEYWGMGYNQASKMEILKLAFVGLGMEHVFAGARTENARSQRAQEKLPYIRLNVESQFPDEHEALENREKQHCVLHAFYRDDFFAYLQLHNISNAKGPNYPTGDR